MIKEFILLFNTNQKKQASILLIMMFIGMLLETLSIGVIIPVLSIVTDTEAYTKYPSLKFLFDLFGDNTSTSEILLVAIIIILIIYMIKTFYLIYLSHKQTKFIYNTQASISKRLFNTYLKQPYIFHLKIILLN